MYEPTRSTVNEIVCPDCGRKGYVVIYNVYDEDYEEIETCPLCGGLGVLSISEEKN